MVRIFRGGRPEEDSSPTRARSCQDTVSAPRIELSLLVIAHRIGYFVYLCVTLFLFGDAVTTNPQHFGVTGHTVAPMPGCCSGPYPPRPYQIS